MIGFINKKLRQYYVFSKDIRDKYNIKKENNPKYFTSKWELHCLHGENSLVGYVWLERAK